MPGTPTSALSVHATEDQQLPLFEDSINKDHLQVLRGWLNTVQDVKSVDVAGMSEKDNAWQLAQLMDRILTSPLDDVLKSGRTSDPPDANEPFDRRRKIRLETKDKQSGGWKRIPSEWQLSLFYLRNVGFEKAPLAISKVDMKVLDEHAAGSGALTDAQQREINAVLSKYGSQVKPGKAPKPPAVVFDPKKSIYAPAPVFAGTLRNGKEDVGLVAARAKVTDIYGPAPALAQDEAELIDFVRKRYELVSGASGAAIDLTKLVPGPKDDDFVDTAEANQWKLFDRFLEMPKVPGPPGSNDYYVPLDVSMLAGQAHSVDPSDLKKYLTNSKGEALPATELRTAVAIAAYIRDAVSESHWEATVTGRTFRERVGQLAKDMAQAGSRTFAEHKEMHLAAAAAGRHENPPKDVRDFYDKAKKEIARRMNDNTAPTSIIEYYRMAKELSLKAERSNHDKQDDLMRDILLGKVDLVRAEKIATGRDDKDRKKEREQEEKGRKAAHV